MAKPLKTLLYDETDILERVDEYSLFCRYLEYEPTIGLKYPSPIRSDDNKDSHASFGLFVRKYGRNQACEFMWKDQGKGVHGDIFDLVGYLYGLTRWAAMQQVCVDSDIGGIVQGERKIITAVPKFMGASNIRIISKPFSWQDLAYWKKYNVDVNILRRHNVTALKAYWLTDNQIAPLGPGGLGFAYRIWNKYQLYFPYKPKDHKFRTDWTDLCVPGFEQLQHKSPLCIVTKAKKDVMCLESFGYEAIAPRGESILLPKECIEYLQDNYEKVVTLFDNDGKHKASEYPFEELHVPQESGEKDPSDYCDKFGPEKTGEMLSLLLH